MTGSLKWFNYQSDDDEEFAVLRDESAGEATAGGIALLSAYSTGRSTPSTLRPRYLNCSLSTNAAVRKRFVVGDPTVFNSITGSSTITEAAGGQAAGGTWRVHSKRGEQERFPQTGDGGQLDGDPT